MHYGNTPNKCIQVCTLATSFCQPVLKVLTLCVPAPYNNSIQPPDVYFTENHLITMQGFEHTLPSKSWSSDVGQGVSGPTDDYQSSNLDVASKFELIHPLGKNHL